VPEEEVTDEVVAVRGSVISYEVFDWLSLLVGAGSFVLIRPGLEERLYYMLLEAEPESSISGTLVLGMIK